MKEKWLEEALKRHYAKLVGELQRIEQPPKYEMRLNSDRARHAEEAGQKRERADQIRADLPHLAHVIWMFDPAWDERTVKPIRPTEQRESLPSLSFAGAAMDILREASGAYTIRELVFEIADRFHLDIGSSDAYQKVHTAVNNGLKASYRPYIKSLGGRPERFAHIDFPDDS